MDDPGIAHAAPAPDRLYRAGFLAFLAIHLTAGLTVVITGAGSRPGTFAGVAVAGKGKGYHRAARGGARARRLSKMSEVSEAYQ